MIDWIKYSETCSISPLLPVSYASQTIDFVAYSRVYANPQKIPSLLRTLIFETCSCRHISALNQICQIGDCIANSSNPVNTQNITACCRTLFLTCSCRYTLPVSFIPQTIGLAGHSRYATNPQSMTICSRTLILFASSTELFYHEIRESGNFTPNLFICHSLRSQSYASSH